MASITTILSTDLITNSRATINTNFANLNTDKIETSVIDTDTTLAANSDAKLPSQKAVKAYVDAGGNVNASTSAKGIVEEATAAEISSRSGTGATGARLFINPSTGATAYPATSVFTGTAPNATFTDLDLSAVVGAAERMVMIKVRQTTGQTGQTWYSFITKGDAVEINVSTFGPNVSVMTNTNGIDGYAIVKTSSAGVVQWTGNRASLSVTLTVLSFW